jgi:5-hydroxyisourate hydrolase
MTISTHVLDVAGGRPAEGTRTTDVDGRVGAFDGVERPGVYRLTFDVEGSYPGSFFPSASITFRVDDPTPHLHVPLLLSPFGYTTYRGS